MGVLQALLVAPVPEPQTKKEMQQSVCVSGFVSLGQELHGAEWIQPRSEFPGPQTL